MASRLGLVISVLLLSCGCTTVSGAGATANASDETLVTNEALRKATVSHALVSALLGIDADRHYWTDDQGKRYPDELAAYKELEKIYLTLLHSARSASEQQAEALKLIMFFSFYAQSRNSAAFNESLASDLRPLFDSDPNAFLDALAETPFASEAVCNRLHAWFGFEDQPAAGRAAFLESNRELIRSRLPASGAASCLDALAGVAAH